MRKALFIIAFLFGSTAAWACHDWHFYNDWDWHYRWPRYRWHTGIRSYPYPVWIEKKGPSIAEQKKEEARIREERLEKTRLRNEAYKEERGRYPIPKIVLSPNHPQSE